MSRSASAPGVSDSGREELGIVAKNKRSLSRSLAPGSWLLAPGSRSLGCVAFGCGPTPCSSL